MTAVAFDTLKLARKLRDSAHMSQEQAEGVADALAEAMSGAELATKSDIAVVKSDIRELTAAIKSDIRQLELKLEGRFEAIDGRFEAIEGRFEAINGRFETVNERIERRGTEIESRLIKWVIGMGVAAILTIVGAAWAIISRLPLPLPHP